MRVSAEVVPREREAARCPPAAAPPPLSGMQAQNPIQPLKGFASACTLLAVPVQASLLRTVEWV